MNTKVVVLAVVALLASLAISATASAADTIVAVDSAGNVGRAASLALDASGNPVIAYEDQTNGDLKLAHCNDANCAGGDESTVAVDHIGFAVDFSSGYASLALDASGHPVIAYDDLANDDLKLAHCNDANCNPSVNGPESIVALDTDGITGRYPSLKLDAGGNPVIAYYDAADGDMKLVHCNDADCDPAANGPESITSVDAAGRYLSLALDAAGYPVISYLYYTADADLRLAHCNDANCAGGDESIVAVDTPGFVGSETSLALDASGNPAISYFDQTNFDLKLARCNDPNCAGNDESLVSLPDAGYIGSNTSLALDGSDDPVIVFYDHLHTDLRLVHCNDAKCTGGNETVVVLETTGGWGGSDVSLALDGGGNPAIAYYDPANHDLKLARCDDGNCLPDADGDGIADAIDNCPSIANADQTNTDGDSEGDACDADDDNDGVPDVSDAFPLDPTESVDTDGDRIGNNADTDDDNDGLPDLLDAAPLDADADDDGLVDGIDPDVIGNVVAGLPDSAFAPVAAGDGNKSAMLSVLDQIEQQVQGGDFAGAIQKLSNLRKRVDGCGVKADKNDWITNCTDQLSVRILIDTMIKNLKGA